MPTFLNFTPPHLGLNFPYTQGSRAPQFVCARSELCLFRKIKFEQIFSAGNADILLRLEISHLQGCTGNFFHCRCHKTSRLKLPILQFDKNSMVDDFGLKILKFDKL